MSFKQARGCEAFKLPKSRPLILGIATLCCLSSLGCQVEIGGQTLPSPYYQYDDVQFFAPGPEFKLSREAAAIKEMQAQEQLDQP